MPDLKTPLHDERRCFSVPQNSRSSTALERPRQNCSRSELSRISLKSSEEFVRGDRVCDSHVSSLSSLYHSQYTRFPSFPSIYQTKYQRDFQYVPWTAKICHREFTPMKDYRSFKIGGSSYSDEFKMDKIQAKPPLVRPGNTQRRNNPQPRMGLVQNYPNQPRWKNSFLDNCKTKSAGDSHPAQWISKEPRMHRWNSR